MRCRREIQKALRIGYVTAVLVSCGHRAPPPGKPDATPPELRWLYPAEGTVIHPGDSVGVVFEAVDSSDVVRALLKVGGVIVAGDSTPPLELLWIVDTARFHPTQETLVLVLEVADFWDNVARQQRKVLLPGLQKPSPDSPDSP